MARQGQNLQELIALLTAVLLTGLLAVEAGTRDMMDVLDVRVSEFGFGEKSICYFTVSNRSDSVVHLKRLFFRGTHNQSVSLDNDVDIAAKSSVRWRGRRPSDVSGLRVTAVDAAFKNQRLGLFEELFEKWTLDYIDGKVSKRSLSSSEGFYEEGMMGGTGWCWGTKSEDEFLDGSLSIMAICRNPKRIDVTIYNRGSNTQCVNSLEICEGTRVHRYRTNVIVSPYARVEVPITFNLPIKGKVSSIKALEVESMDGRINSETLPSRTDWLRKARTDSNHVIRCLPPDPFDPMSYNLFLPQVEPVPGCIVRCGLMEVLDHSGIYVGNGKIVHRDGDGSVAEVTPQEFLRRLNGANRATRIYVSCDDEGRPVGGVEIAQRALAALSDPELNKGYDVLTNNCHRFCYYCVTGDRGSVCPRFVDLQDWTGCRNWRATDLNGTLPSPIPTPGETRTIYVENMFWGIPAESMPYGVIGVQARPLPIMLKLLREQEDAEISESQFVEHWSDILKTFLRRLNWRVTPAYGDYYAALGMACYENAFLFPDNAQWYYMRAHEWWGRGAMVGNTLSCYNLGCLYAKGLGKEKSFDKSRMLWSRAASLGNGEAKKRLEELDHGLCR